MWHTFAWLMSWCWWCLYLKFQEKRWTGRVGKNSWSCIIRNHINQVIVRNTPVPCISVIASQSSRRNRSTQTLTLCSSCEVAAMNERFSGLNRRCRSARGISEKTLSIPKLSWFAKGHFFTNKITLWICITDLSVVSFVFVAKVNTLRLSIAFLSNFSPYSGDKIFGDTVNNWVDFLNELFHDKCWK